MWTAVLVNGIILGVFVGPVLSEKITVCQEEDNDLRVDCPVDPTPNQVRMEYEFSMATGGKETLINTNVSGVMADDKFRRDQAYAELLDDILRLTIKDFILSENTTFMCKISGHLESVNIEPDQLVPCSALSAFLSNGALMLSLLSSLYLLLPLGLTSH
ncbi:uncharacterized protein LOC143111626 [Alosa pseudoharengus]|uniref:uncharacterized protein LOC143111626 n=1 Tax=Alosa pseudoharengus TaxID=34774 RepID=UPI003F89D082